MSNIVREYLDEEDIKEALRDYLRHNRAYVIIQGLRPAHVELKYDAKTRRLARPWSAWSYHSQIAS